MSINVSFELRSLYLVEDIWPFVCMAFQIDSAFCHVKLLWLSSCFVTFFSLVDLVLCGMHWSNLKFHWKKKFFGFISFVSEYLALTLALISEHLLCT